MRRTCSHVTPPLPLGFTPEAPAAYDANKFNRNHIKQTPCSIDCKDDIIPLTSQPFTSPERGSKVWRGIFRDPLSGGGGVVYAHFHHLYVHAREHSRYGGFCSGIEVSILVRSRQGRQSMRQLH